ncbi:alpha-1,2-mannosyltransferase ALG9 [Aedes albopictus]|uniref:Mannosyltransferase n=1 Tax=Aedes albopictus TaxID=7160 RepID=A0ABM1YXR9_AEDAL
MKSIPVFSVILVARLLSAKFLHITDCDETYNYWEPLHYLLFGKGMQTWEYSPEYGLRSYLYLILHAVPAWIMQKVANWDAVTLFYCIRCVLAVVCAMLETIMYRSIHQQFGSLISKLWLIFQVFSPGMYISSTAFLPSSFSMLLTIAFISTWWQKQYKLAILSIVVSTFIGWPFAALVSLPFVYTVLVQKRLFKMFFCWSFLFAASVAVPLALVDSYIYGKLTFAPLNIVLYNIFSKHGPNLFGVESKYFYFINLFLNFNVVWCLALICPVFIFMKYVLQKLNKSKVSSTDALRKLLPLYIWLLVFFMQPHKEERFIFPVYPLVSLCGAVALSTFLQINDLVLQRCGKPALRIARRLIMYGVTTGFILLSLSRLYALYANYHAPMEISSSLDVAPVARNVCLGKEWHRFPGSFFIPSNYRLRFVPSHFGGLLPAYFDESGFGTTIVHNYFNNMNQPNRHMLFELSRCDYLIDFDNGGKYVEGDSEPNYSKDSGTWTIVKSVPFLDASASHSLYRAFYVPYVGERYVKFGSYNLLERKK